MKKKRSCRRVLSLAGIVMLAAVFVFGGMLQQPARGTFGPAEVYADQTDTIEIIGAGDQGVLTEGFTQEEADSRAAEIRIKYNGPEAAVLHIDFNHNEWIDVSMPNGDNIAVEPGDTVTVFIMKLKEGTPVGTQNTWIYIDAAGSHKNTGVSFGVVSEGLSVFWGQWQFNNQWTSLYLGSSVEGSGLASNWGFETFDIGNNGSESFTLDFSSDDEMFGVRQKDGTEGSLFLKEGQYAEMRAFVNENVVLQKKAGKYSAELTATATTTSGITKTIIIPVEFEILSPPAFNMREYSAVVSTERMHTGDLISFNITGKYALKDFGKQIKYEISNDDLEIRVSDWSGIRLKSNVSEPKTYEAELRVYYDPTCTGSFPAEPCDTVPVRIEVWDSEAYQFEVYDGNEKIETGWDAEIDLGTLYEGYSSHEAKKLQKQIRLKNTGTGDLEFSTDSMRNVSYDQDKFILSSGSGYETVAPGSFYNRLTIMPAAALPAGRYECEAVFSDRSGRASETGVSKMVRFYVNVVRKGLDFDLQYRWREIPKGGISLGTLHPGTERFEDFDINNKGEYAFDCTVTSNKDYIKITRNPETIGVGGTGFAEFTVDTKGLETGGYNAEISIKAVSKEDSAVVKEVKIPVSFRVDDSEVDVTLDLQGVGGLENYVKKNVPASELVFSAAYDLMNDKGRPEADGYIGLGITQYPDRHYHSWGEFLEELRDHDKTETLHVSDVQQLYYNWAKEIKTDSITVKAPVCGSGGDAMPEVIISGGSHYHAAEVEYYDEKGEPVQKLEYGKKYETYITLEADWGYAFDGEYKTLINGKDGSVYFTDNRSRIVLRVNDFGITEHDWNEGTITTPATAGSDGVKTFTCRSCGVTKTETIPRTAAAAPEASGTSEIADRPAVKISKPKAAKKSLTVRWKKLSKGNLKKTKKIQIQYSTDRSFSTGAKTKLVNAKKSSFKIKGLKSKKKYYVRIRAYTRSGGSVHVSKWSAVKSVKTK